MDEPDTRSDAWFMVAIAYAGGTKVDLTDVIDSGDAINKAIFTVDEIEHAVRRLVSAGLLEVDNSSFTLTRDGVSLYERARHESIYDTMTTLGQLVDRKAPPSAVGTVDWRLDPEALHRASEDHRQRVERYLKK